MQVTQLFRRGVVRPLDELGARQLRAFWIESPVRVEWLPVLGETQFSAIWGSGILQELNKACGVRISDYEEVIIEPRQLKNAIAALKSMRSPSNDDARRFFDELQELLAGSEKSGLPVMFVL